MKNAFFKYLNILIIVSLLLFTSCKKVSEEGTQEIENSAIQNDIISAQDIEQLNITEFVLSDQVIKITEDWEKFNTFTLHIEDLKKGMLSFFKDDKAFLEGFITDFKTTIPEAINKSSVQVRISALETVIYKLDEAANIQNSAKDVLLENINDILVGYNNLVYQINKEVEGDSQKIIKP